MSGLFGSVTIKGNRITDFAQTTATVGIPLPFGYGIVPFDGNVIFAALPPKEHVSKKRQGKGGTKTETYTYTMSYAVAFCAGPIFGYRWIKRNGKIVYTTDPNAPIEDQAYAAKWAQKVQFYFGTSDQMPNSTIESYEGSGQISAFRDVAYIVVEDDDVTDGSGAVPTYEACCICSPPEAYLTSKPYPIFLEDQATIGLSNVDAFERIINHIQDVTPNAATVHLSPTGGSLRSPLIVTDVQPNAASISVVPTGGLMKLVQRVTDVQPNAASVTITPIGGVLDEVLITTNVQPNAASISLTPTGGSLS